MARWGGALCYLNRQLSGALTPEVERRLAALASFNRKLSRVLVDALYFSHRDWPKGKQFIVGHFLLTALFIFLAAGYWGLLLWHLVLRVVLGTS